MPLPPARKPGALHYIDHSSHSPIIRVFHVSHTRNSNVVRCRRPMSPSKLSWLVPREGPGGACSYSISLKEECPHLQHGTKSEGAATSASTSASSSSCATPVPPPLPPQRPPLCRFEVPPPGGPRRTVIRVNWKGIMVLI